MRQFGAKNLTWVQKLQIETLFNAKTKVNDIAKQVGVDRSTIYRELKRGMYQHKQVINDFWKGTKTIYTKRYSPNLSQELYKIKCTNKGRPLKIGNDYKFVHYMEERVVKDKISPCAVLGQIKRNNIEFDTNISKTTLYRYIKMGLFENIRIEKRKERYKKVAIKRISKGTSIEKRPEEIQQRNTFGHWEMDCVRGSSKTTLLVLSERLTRQEIIFKMENQKSASVISCLNRLEYKFGKKFKQIFKSITVDNGSEFADHIALEKSIYGKNNKRTSVYYCHPYCSSERGTNERLNREIRRQIPKGSNLANFSIEEIEAVEKWVNNYPRQVLGYATSQELFNEHLKAIA